MGAAAGGLGAEEGAAGVMVGALAIVADLEDGGEAWAGIRVCFVRWRMVKEWNRRCARGGGLLWCLGFGWSSKVWR